MLFLGANLEFPGAVFFDEQRGRQTFQKHPLFEDVRGEAMSENVTQGQSEPTQNCPRGYVFVENIFSRKDAMCLIKHLFN